MTPEEIYTLAAEHGFSVEYDNDGQLVLYTDVYDNEDEEETDDS